MQYFPFGETWVSEQSNTERLPYLFTSKELDEETALYYFGARYYDPRTSVWQSTDPALPQFLVDGGELSSRWGLFGYVTHNPVQLVDPDGRLETCYEGPCRQGFNDDARWQAAQQQTARQPVANKQPERQAPKTPVLTPNRGERSQQQQYDTKWVQGEMGRYRDEWGPWSAAVWPFVLAELHDKSAKYDYHVRLMPQDAKIEVTPGRWGTASDLGNYMAGYGAGYGPHPAETPTASILMHLHGGKLNRERDQSGLFGDSKRSEIWIRRGYKAGLEDNFERFFIPYWLRGAR